MNCIEANDCFGDAIDGSLSESFRRSFSEHLESCRTCRRSFELESITKLIVQDRCPRVSTPLDIRQSIVSALNEPSAARVPFLEWVQSVFTLRRLVPALVISVAFVLALVFFGTPNASPESDVHDAPNDVIFQSLQNFAQIQKGTFRPALVASKAEDIHQYLDSNGFDFAVVHPLECCTSYGAMTSKYNGIKLASVVYRMNDDVMYVYQVRKEHVFRGSALVIPPAARTALEKTGWYTDPHHPSCNVILWIADETLCAAVSSMKKDEMLALLNRN